MSALLMALRVARRYRTYLAQRLSRWGEQGFSSGLVAPRVSCRHYHPAEVFLRIGPFFVGTGCLHPRAAGSTFEAIVFEAPYVFVFPTT